MVGQHLILDNKVFDMKASLEEMFFIIKEIV